MKSQIVVGIDPGTKTGIGVWCMTDRRLIEVVTLDMYDAQAYIADLKTRHEIFIIMEDAHKRAGGKNAAAKAQGAGSVKRDCSLWRTWAKKQGIPLCGLRPAMTFKGALGEKLWHGALNSQGQYWPGKTDDHGRDAAWLAFGVNEPTLFMFRDLATAQLKPKVKPRQKPALKRATNE